MNGSLMKRVKLKVAYEGTQYHGWQLQKNGETIESQLNLHLSALLKEDIQVIGASRTDAGVHALSNIAIFDTSHRMPAEKISYALNQRLPEDIRIMESVQVASDFHPRKCASKKTYEYHIYHAPFPNPLIRNTSFFTYVDLDLTEMKRALPYFIGTHDFKSFASIHSSAETTIRTIYQLCIDEDGPLIKIRITGNGFLYNMVRIIAGTLLEIGQGRMRPEDIPQIIATCDRSKAGPTAPAKGLTLYAYEFVDGEDKPLLLL